MALTDPNNLPMEQRQFLASYDWGPNNPLDLHKMGVHYYTPLYLPTQIDPLTYSSYLHRGLTPPMALPILTPENTQERITKFLDMNYFKLANGGLQYLGNEFNVQRPEAWDTSEVRVCIVRLSDYRTVDGAFGQYLIGNFITDYTDNVFVDYAYFPDLADLSKLYDADLPLMWGNISKQPLTAFDVVIFATSYPGERVNLPAAMVKSGLPLYRWQRFSKDLPYRQKGQAPMIALAGIGSAFIENCLGDNPRYGPAQNGMADHVLIGEGEMLDLKYVQQYLYTVKKDGGTKEDFCKVLTNEHHMGCYDPSLVLFNYADKVYEERDHTGKVLGQRTYQAGGHISSIDMLDHDTKTRWRMAGPGSEEFQDMEPVNAQYHLRLLSQADPAELGRKYVKINDKLPEAVRKSVLSGPDEAPKHTLKIGLNRDS